MSVVDAEPELIDDDVDDPGMVHTVCCNEDKALCGEDMADSEDSEADMPECVVCFDLYGKPCAAPFCRFRMLWRTWWPW